MNEREFLNQLEKRAQEQEAIIKKMPFQGLFTTTSLWLGEHPWRILIPAALVITLLLRLTLGSGYYNLILKIFGGFGMLIK